MGNELAKAIKKKTDAQFRVNRNDYTPSVIERSDGTVVYNDPSQYITPIVAGKNVSIGTSGANKVINAIMNLVAGANITVSEPDENGAVTVSVTLPDEYILPQSTSLILGGVKAPTKTIEELPVAIDESGFLFTADKVLTGETLPIADETYRGKIFTVLGASGVTDATYICLKTASDTYAWTAI